MRALKQGGKVALVGFADSSRALAPWDDDTFEIWGLNMAHSWMPRWDRLFELHDMSTLEAETEEMKRDCDHLGALRAERSRPVYMLRREETVPASEPYPLQEVAAFLGAHCDKILRQPYLASTPGMMLALALALGAREVHCYGIDLVQDEEYGYQRPNFEFLCGVAVGLGVRLVVPENSAVLQAEGVYGFDNGESLVLLSRLREKTLAKAKKLTAMREEAAMRREKAKADWNSFDGARQILEEQAGQLLYIMRGGKV